MEGQKIRDIIIGIALMVVGVITLLHTLKIFVFDEGKIALFASLGLLGLGAVMLISYLFTRENIWIFIFSLCLFFLAGMVYILNLMPDHTALIGVLLFGILALAFLLVFITSPEQWWAMLVGWICLGLAGTVYTSAFHLNLSFLPVEISSNLPPLLLFTSMALGFIFVWLMKPRERWWSLLTAGMIAAVESTIVMHAINVSDIYIPITMFLVAGITFLLVSTLSNKENDLKWAVYPAIVLISFSAFLYLITFWHNNGQLVLSIMFLSIGGLFIFKFIKDSYSGGQARNERPLTTEKTAPTASDDDLASGSLSSVPSQGFSSEERESLLSTEERKLKEVRPVFPAVDYPLQQLDEDEEEDDDNGEDLK